MFRRAHQGGMGAERLKTAKEQKITSSWSLFHERMDWGSQEGAAGGIIRQMPQKIGETVIKRSEGQMKDRTNLKYKILSQQWLILVYFNPQMLNK